MKFKEFMVNSLPRSKNKRKKKIDPQPPLVPSPQSINDLRESPTASLKAAEVDVSKRVTVNHSLVTDDFKYLSEKVAPPAAASENDKLKLNFNISIVENKCACYKHIDAQKSFAGGEGRRSLDYRLPLDDACLYNTVPRVRSRIKTNPWLPSPRTSPAQTPSASPHSSVSASPMTSPITSPLDRLSMDSSTDSAFVSQTNSPDSEECHTDMKTKTSDLGLEFSIKTTSDIESVSTPRVGEDTELHLLQQSFTSCETDNSVTANERHYFPGLYDFDTPKSSCENLNGDDIAYIMQEKDRVPDISFEYEEAFESQMERKSVGQYLSSRDDFASSREMFSSRDDFSTTEEKSRENLQSEDSQDNWDSVTDCTESDCSVPAGEEFYWTYQNNRDSTGTDDTLCGDFPAVRMSQSFTAYSCYERDQQEHATEHRQVFSDGYDEDGFNHMEFAAAGKYGAKEEEDSGVYCTAGNAKLPRAQMSFQEKINRLREEKSVVNEKIRHAQEEERLRMQEKMRFQKQITMYRKQILLRTLADLKSKLENQSQRLQRTYDNVLTLQRNYTRERIRAKSATEVATTADPREAPF